MTKRKCSNYDGYDNVYTVETIYKKKIRNNKEPLYYIKWEGWDERHNSWEPLSNILDHSLIETFEDELRQKKKLRKKATETQKDNSDKIGYESDANNSDSKDEIENGLEQRVTDDPMTEDKKNDEWVSLRQMYISIPKMTINLPESDNLKLEKPLVNGVTPTYSVQKKEEVLKSSQHDLCKSDIRFQKPKRLLSINEYSAAIKTQDHHIKATKNIPQLENSNSEPEEKVPIARIPNLNLQTFSTDNQPTLLPKDSENSPKSRLGEPILKNMASKLKNDRFKFHSHSIVTDVTVQDLSITVKEMSYEEFINDSQQRYQVVHLPTNSEWMMRYQGKYNDEVDINDLNVVKKDESQNVTDANNNSETMRKQDSWEDFGEYIITDFDSSIVSGSVISNKNLSGSSSTAVIHKTITSSPNSVEELYTQKDPFLKIPVTSNLTPSTLTYGESLGDRVQSSWSSCNQPIEMPKLHEAPWIQYGDTSFNQALEMPKLINPLLLTHSSYSDPNLDAVNHQSNLAPPLYRHWSNSIVDLCAKNAEEEAYPIDLTSKWL